MASDPSRPVRLREIAEYGRSGNWRAVDSRYARSSCYGRAAKAISSAVLGDRERGQQTALLVVASLVFMVSASWPAAFPHVPFHRIARSEGADLVTPAPERQCWLAAVGPPAACLRAWGALSGGAVRP